MQTFIDTATQQVWSFDTDVQVVDTNGVYAFETATGAALNVPTTLQPYVMPVPTPPTAAQLLAQQAQTALGAGLTITSTSTPALDGVYACDPTTIGFVNSEINAILLNATFADGSTALEWPDMTGALHLYTIAQFKTLAVALGEFVSGIRKCVIGATGATLPPATATIA